MAPHNLGDSIMFRFAWCVLLSIYLMFAVMMTYGSVLLLLEIPTTGLTTGMIFALLLFGTALFGSWIVSVHVFTVMSRELRRHRSRKLRKSIWS